MAYEKQGWKEALQAAIPKGGRSSDPINPQQQKKNSQIMYKRRKLDKAIKNYCNNNNPIKFKRIEEICATI